MKVDKSNVDMQTIELNPIVENGMYKICLVRTAIIAPKGSFNNEPTPPIGLAYLASSLKDKGFKVEGIDGVVQGLGNSSESTCGKYKIDGLSNEEIVDLIPQDVQLIGISVMFTHEWLHVRDCIKLIRKKFPNQIIVVGGEHASGLPEYTLRDCLEINCCVIGEGEETICEIAEKAMRGEKFYMLNGVAYINKDNEFIQNEPRIRIKELDNIPWPDWQVFNITKYLDTKISYGASFGRNMPIMASRGCPYKCTFCSNLKMWGIRYKLRSVDDVINEIKYYKNKYHIDGLQFTDLTAIVKKKWILEFTDRLFKEKLNIKWSLPSGTRSEALDEEVLSGLEKSGLRYLVYAPESGSSRMLSLIKKKIVLSEMTESIKKALRLKIPLRTNFIIGFPGEKRIDIYKTMMYAYYYSVLGVDEAPLYIFSPYPGTELFEELVSTKEIEMNDDYIIDLISLSTGNLKPPDKAYSGSAGKYEVYFYRILSMVVTYSFSYIFHPKRIIRTIRSLRSDLSSTVFEQRLKSLAQRLSSL